MICEWNLQSSGPNPNIGVSFQLAVSLRSFSTLPDPSEYQQASAVVGIPSRDLCRLFSCSSAIAPNVTLLPIFNLVDYDLRLDKLSWTQSWKIRTAKSGLKGQLGPRLFCDFNRVFGSADVAHSLSPKFYQGTFHGSPPVLMVTF